MTDTTTDTTDTLDVSLRTIAAARDALWDLEQWAIAHPHRRVHVRATHGYIAADDPADLDALTGELLDGADPGTVTRDRDGRVARDFGMASIAAFTVPSTTHAAREVLNP